MEAMSTAQAVQPQKQRRVRNRPRSCSVASSDYDHQKSGRKSNRSVSSRLLGLSLEAMGTPRRKHAIATHFRGESRRRLATTVGGSSGRSPSCERASYERASYSIQSPKDEPACLARLADRKETADSEEDLLAREESRVAPVEWVGGDTDEWAACLARILTSPSHRLATLKAGLVVTRPRASSRAEVPDTKRGGGDHVVPSPRYYDIGWCCGVFVTPQ